MSHFYDVTIFLYSSGFTESWLRGYSQDLNAKRGTGLDRGVWCLLRLGGNARHSNYFVTLPKNVWGYLLFKRREMYS
jgi:hypothetical protein